MTSEGDTRLVRDQRVRLPDTGEVVRLLDVRPGAFWHLVYRGEAGPGEITLSEAEAALLEIITESDRARFDSDPIAFRLGVEAKRIQTAFTHDMAALAVSNIQPLPHQLEAVYSEFLRQPRLRFLLADDPGAGKTIMAGLYMKELELRRSADRVLIVAPANLLPQWARELEERFGFEFDQVSAQQIDNTIRGNPWDRFNRVIVSRDFLKNPERLEQFVAARRPWDLAVIDEAHGFTLQTDTKGTIKQRSLRYKAAEQVAAASERLLLMTATPHSGKTESFWGLLRLLDRDAFGDRCPRSLPAPDGYYRKVSKEKMTDMDGAPLFRERNTATVEFDLEGAEKELYQAVTEFVQTRLREIRGEADQRTAGFALTTMQRRLASSVRAIKRTISRRIERIDRALADPAAYLRNRKDFRQQLVSDPETLADLDDEALWQLEQAALDEALPATVEELRQEREALLPLLDQAEAAETAGQEKKLNELLDVVRDEGLWEDRSRLLVIFTEHRDTLDYLVEKLSADFDVATIHGGMKLAERIEQERRFREEAQILVATEAAGEGINLQFCHLMVNYDIPWNPNRLEQRMGRIHRIGQTRDVHIFNMVAVNTREGRVLATLLRKINAMRHELGDGVFDVIGDTFAGYRLQELMEFLISGDMSAEDVVDRLGGDVVDPQVRQRARDLMQEALAKQHVDWRSEREQYQRAQERRLPPGYFQRFLADAVTWLDGKVEERLDDTVNISTPNRLVAASRAAGATRQVFPTYKKLTFDRQVAERPSRDETGGGPPPELCGPGHPLFDAAVEAVLHDTASDLERGAIVFDPDTVKPHVLCFVTGDVVDSDNNIAHRRFDAVRVTADGHMEQAPHTSLFDLVVPDDNQPAPEEPPAVDSGTADDLERWCREHLFEDDYQRVRAERQHAADIQQRFVEASARSVIADIERTLMDLEDEVEQGVKGAEGRLRQAQLDKEQHLQRRNNRIAEIGRNRDVRRGPVRLIGRALVLPLPVEASDYHDGATETEEIEQIAINVAWHYEEGRGAKVESYEKDNIGFDLLSTTKDERRCIEVKGRAGYGAVALSWSEFAKAQEIGDDYWLYAVLDCASADPRLYRIHNPAQALLGAFRPNLDVKFAVAPDDFIPAAEENPA
ncbi:ERCC4-related helicase [Saccharomonospora amisosensis]|uniref:ERCC4-related helicase n=1 Tax=Saccharomonospora amisosensis TaxID=1128677 RepID=A0A7X5UM07_9PSEU|nr:helicase-related protein [Saccharomonospora amisosensis]NIJ10489.1 ERCC4-related helicase [Saccharomonospora amisosensis]